MAKDVSWTRCFREAQRWGLKLGGSPSGLAVVKLPLTLAVALTGVFDGFWQSFRRQKKMIWRRKNYSGIVEVASNFMTPKLGRRQFLCTWQPVWNDIGKTEKIRIKIKIRGRGHQGASVALGWSGPLVSSGFTR